MSVVGYLHRLLGLQESTSVTLVKKLVAGAAMVHVHIPNYYYQGFITLLGLTQGSDEESDECVYTRIKMLD